MAPSLILLPSSVDTAAAILPTGSRQDQDREACFPRSHREVLPPPHPRLPVSALRGARGLWIATERAWKWEMRERAQRRLGEQGGDAGRGAQRGRWLWTLDKAVEHLRVQQLGSPSLHSPVCKLRDAPPTASGSSAHRPRHPMIFSPLQPGTRRASSNFYPQHATDNSQHQQASPR